MATEGLKIIVGADVSNATSNLKKGEQAVTSFANTVDSAVGNVDSSFEKVGKSSRKATSAIGELTEGVKTTSAAAEAAGIKFRTALDSAFVDGTKTIAQLRSEIKALNTAFETTTEPAQLKLFADRAKQLQLQIDAVRASVEEPIRINIQAPDVNKIGAFGQAFAQVIKPVDQLQQEIAQLQAALGKTTEPKMLRLYTDRIAQLQTQINNLKVFGAENQLKKLDKAAGQAGNALGRISRPTNEANNALINVGRVFQDLPFGIIGVANNINPLLESFQRLKTSSTTTGGVIKALGASLIGGGGLGLAVSLITSALTFASIGFQAFSRGAGDAKKSVEDAISIFPKFKDAIADAASAEFANNVAPLEKYIIALKDTEVPLRQRTLALQNYNKVASEGNKISEADINNIDKINAAINRQISLLQQRALIKGAEDQIAKLIQQNAKSLFIIDNAIDNIERKREKAAQIAKTNPLDLFSSSSSEDVKNFTNEIFKVKKATDALGSAKTFGLLDSIESGKGAIQDLFDFINRRIKEGAQFGDVFDPVKQPKLKEAFVAFKRQYDDFRQRVETIPFVPIPFSLELQPLADASKLALKFSSVKEELDRKLKQFALKTSTVPTLIKQQIQLDLNLIRPPQVREDIEADIRSQFASPMIITFGVEARPEIKVDTKNIQRTLNQSIAQAFNQFGIESIETIGNTLGETLGDVFSGKGIGDGFKNLVSGLADNLERLGKNLVKAGAIAIIAKKAIASLFSNPYVSIAAGIALVAAARVIKNSFSGAREQGGPVSRANKYLVNEKEEEYFQSGNTLQKIKGGPQIFTPKTSGKVLTKFQAINFANKMNIPKLAGGGVINSATFSLLGENGPEFVAPLATLPKLIAGMLQPQTAVVPVLRGKDISLQQARQSRYNNRNV